MKILVSANGFGGATSKSGVLAIPLVAATGTSASRDTAHLAEVDRRSKQTAWPPELLLETWILRFPQTWALPLRPSFV